MSSVIFRCLKLLVLIGLIPTVSSAGDGLRGGGDVVECSKSSENSYEGFYALGYIQKTLVSESQKSTIEQSGTCSEVLERVQSNIKKVSPLLAVGLGEFIRSYKEPNLYSSSSSVVRSWKRCKKLGCLSDLKDEGIQGHIVVKLPENCKSTQQFAVRKTRFNNQKVFVDYYLDDELNKKLPGFQCAYNLVHEWLRDHIHQSDNLYSATFHLFDSKIEDQVKRKVGIYSYIDRSFFDSRKSPSIGAYNAYLNSTAAFCSGVKGGKICGNVFYKYKGKYGILLDEQGEDLRVLFVSENQNHRVFKTVKSQLEKVDVSDLHPGFLNYLQSLDIESLVRDHRGQSIKTRAPAKDRNSN